MIGLLLLACHRATPAPVTLTSQPLTGPLGSELVVSGPLPRRLAPPDEADLVLLYGGEEQGSLEPCGCAERPPGGLARQAAYVAGTREGSAPVLVLNSGTWLEDARQLDGQPRGDVPVINRWMVAGMQLLAPAAMNVAYGDMAGLRSLVDGPPALPLVSAQIAGEGVEAGRLIAAGPLTVGVTGITTPGVRFIETPGFVVEEPEPAARRAVADLRAQGADLVVLLSYAAAETARDLARDGLVDVVIDADRYRERTTPMRVGSAVWVRSHFQTMRLGELRIGVSEGRITWAVERKIDLDGELPERGPEARLVRTARREIDAIQEEIFGRYAP